MLAFAKSLGLAFALAVLLPDHGELCEGSLIITSAAWQGFCFIVCVLAISQFGVRSSQMD